MKYIIKYDGAGRLRIRCGKFAFSEAQGYGIVKSLKNNSYVCDASSNCENGSILVLYKLGYKKEILSFFDRLRKEELLCCEPSENEVLVKTDKDFQYCLFSKIVRRTVFKAIMPMPIRTAAILFRATKYIAEGVSSLLKCNINVSVLDGAAIAAAIVQNDFNSAGSIMFLLNLSSIMEDYTRKRTKNALSQSLAINVDTVWLVCGKEEIKTPIESVSLGDIIKIRSGSIIPVDGTVISGEAMVNESTMTGEPLSVMKKEGSTVYAGTAVEEGNILVEITAESSESRMSKIIDLIDKSEDLKASVQSKAEKLADSIVPFSFLTSICTYVFTRNLTKAMSVLMVDYSCAIKLSIPISVISAMREAAAHRIMVKGGKFIESFALADTIVFDKTGTLTEACPMVSEVIAMEGYSREEVLKTAACLEEHFPHSVASAIVAKACEEGLNHEEEHAEVEYVVAHGIASKIGRKKAIIGSEHFVFEDEKTYITQKEKQELDEKINGRSAIYLAIGRKLAGVVCISDPVRKEAKQVINALRESGIKHIIMLTGDSESAAKTACAELGITEYRAQVLPEDKAAAIEEIKKQGRQVIMVGDGINDSPALSAANVSVSMKDSSDIAKEVADITLFSSNLNELAVFRKLSVSLLKKVDRNYKFIVSFNTLLLALGIGGVITPQTSAFCHNFSTMGISALSMKPCLRGKDI